MGKFICFVRTANLFGLAFWLIALADYSFRASERFLVTNGDSRFIVVLVLLLPFAAYLAERKTRKSLLHTFAWSLWCLAWIGIITVALVVAHSGSGEFPLSWLGASGVSGAFQLLAFYAYAMLGANLVVKVHITLQTLKELARRTKEP